jgi:hypothetical protein
MLLLKIQVLPTVTFGISAYKRALETEETMIIYYDRALYNNKKVFGIYSASRPHTLTNKWPFPNAKQNLL